jgi:hypothetical protein
MTNNATVTEPEATMTAAELDAEYNRLSYEVGQGNGVAAVKLQRIEERIESAARESRRAAGAKTEADRRAVEAEKQKQADAHTENERQYALALESRDFAFGIVEKVTEDLVEAVRRAIIEGNEAHASALRLGYSPGITATSRISTYIAYKLGRDGADTAGLSGMEPTFPQLRVPLVQPTTTEGA